MDRRLFLAIAAGAAVAPTALLAASRDPVKLEKAFPFLDRYLKLGAGEHSHFTVVYYMSRDGKPAAGLKGWIIDGANRIPVSFGADGHALQWPTLAQMQGSATFQVDAPADAQLKPHVEMHALLPNAAQVDAVALQASINQANAAVKTMAGAMAMMAPKITAAQFPGAPSGQAILATGKAMPLAAGKFGPLYDPSKQPGAKTISLARAPSRILLTPSA